MRAFDEGNLRTAHRAAVEPEVVVSDNTDWHGLGFDRPPFEDSNDVRFFPIGSWENSFDEVSIFCKGHDPLLVIPAITGSGKSVFLNQFIAQQPNPDQCHYLKARSIFTVRHLLNAISDHFSEFRSASGNTEQFLNELRSVTAEAGPQLLIVDDAQRLSKETLSNLLQILAAQDLSNLWLRVVLCGEPQIEDRVQSLFDELELAFTFPAITLESMTMNETRAYLKHRLDNAGYQGNFPYSKSMVKHIHTLASGYPGRINRVAQQVIIDSVKKQTVVAYGSGANSVGEVFHTHRAKFISFAALAVAGWLVWQYQPFQATHSQWSKADLTPSIPLDLASTASHTFRSGSMAPRATTPTAITPSAITPSAIAPSTTSPNSTTTLGTNTSPASSEHSDFIETAVPLKPMPHDLSMSQQKLLSSNSGLRIALPTTITPKVETDSLLDVTKPSITPPLSVALVEADDTEAPALSSDAPVVSPVIPAENKMAAQVMPSLVLTAEQKLAFTKPLQNAASTQSAAIAASKTPEMTSTVAPQHSTKTHSYVNRVAKTPVAQVAHPTKEHHAHAGVKTAQHAKATTAPQFAHSGYTVQLLGVHDKAKLKQFAKQHHLDKNAAYFASQFHGKPWYVLVYGHYDSAEAAHAASTHLPADLQNQHPWVKPVASIDSSIHWLNPKLQS